MQIGSENNKYLEELIDNLINSNDQTESLLRCLSSLKQIIGNIIQEPENEKYQSLRKCNNKIQQDLLSFVYCYEILLFLGFADEGDYFIYESDPIANQQLLQKFNTIISSKLDTLSVNLQIEQANQQIQDNMPKEIIDQINQIEEQKMIRENQIKEFEADKKYNLELKKQGPVKNAKKINFIKAQPKFIGSDDPKKNPKINLAENTRLQQKPLTKKYTLSAQLEERKFQQRAARSTNNQQIKPLKKGGKAVIKTLNDFN